LLREKSQAWRGFYYNPLALLPNDKLKWPGLNDSDRKAAEREITIPAVKMFLKPFIKLLMW
jgi:hypothetical protein